VKSLSGFLSEVSKIPNSATDAKSEFLYRFSNCLGFYFLLGRCSCIEGYYFRVRMWIG
jgi:hypothetical protein